MRNLRVYVETTVWSFALADDSPQFTAETVSFFERAARTGMELVIGPVVLEEVGRAGQPKRDRLVELISRVSPGVLSASEEAVALGEAFVQHGAVPPSKPDDATHVAYAFVSECDALVSWNFKHITNIRRSERFNAIALLCGYRKHLSVVTPSEVTDGSDESR